MFFARIRDWLHASSFRRMALLQMLTFGGMVLVVLYITEWSLRNDMRSNARLQQLNAVHDFARLLQSHDWAAIRTLAGKPEDDTHIGFRLTDSAGRMLHETVTNEVLGYDWDKLPTVSLGQGIARIDIIKDTKDKEAELRVVRRGMRDGTTFWYGQTNAIEVRHLRHLMKQLHLISITVGLLVFIPIVWFARRIVEPLMKLSAQAQKLALTPGRGRLLTRGAPGAIPEVEDIAGAFDESQERIETLTTELHSVNDHLAHELKTPLARVRGNIESLLNHYGEEEGEEAALRSLEEIDRASDLVQTILSIRLGDSGVMRLHLEVTSPKELVQEIVEIYSLAAEAKGHTLVHEILSDNLVLLDRQRIRQAITNLLDNALTYMQKPGEVRIVQQVTVEGGFLLRVQDSGPGLSEADKELIWKRFMRGSASSATTPGTGLGLSLVRAVVHAHYGTVGCENRPEGGAEFWFNLPLAPEMAMERKWEGE
jgi:signal transduction histidine kinase